MSDLDQRLLDAHAAHDQKALIDLYQDAAEQAKDIEAVGFYLTHAYVFALELGHPAAPQLHARLKDMNREE